jgi:hypothetical protein
MAFNRYLFEIRLIFIYASAAPPRNGGARAAAGAPAVISDPAPFAR